MRGHIKTLAIKEFMLLTYLENNLICEKEGLFAGNEKKQILVTPFEH